jgi:hypothetical protein
MQAATKYIGGHSDIMFGTISANAKAWPLVAEAIQLLGVCAGPDDVFLALRGLRTLAVRLAQHHRSGLDMARWLAARPEVIRVLHPALESDPGHAIWQRDFTGASGLFSIVLKPAPQKSIDALLDTVKLFGMGYSWGGFESLVIPFDCASYRTVTKWAPGGPTLRLHIGLENVEDLKADLARGFERLLVLVGFGAYLVWESRRVWAEPGHGQRVAAVARATARSCLIYVLVVSTSVQTWYFCLPVALAVVLGWRATFTRVTVAYSLLALPALHLNYYLRESMPLWVNLVYGLAPLVLLARGSAATVAAWLRAARLRLRAGARTHELAARRPGLW